MSDSRIYTIRHFLGYFINSKLKLDRPLTSEQKFQNIVNYVCTTQKSCRIYKQLKVVASQFCSIRHQNHFALFLNNLPNTNSNQQPSEIINKIDIKNILIKFYRTLTLEQIEIFKSKLAPKLFGKHIFDDFPRFPEDAICLWVAKRAYDYGWNSKLFPRDYSYSSNRRRPTVERIGKKYQWLALNELLAMLTDNCWMSGTPASDDRAPHIYRNPEDLGGMKDIDPTMTPVDHSYYCDDVSAMYDKISNTLMLDSCPETNLYDWPMQIDNYNFCTDELVFEVDGKAWTKLYEHRSIQDTSVDSTLQISQLSKREEFYFICNIMVNKTFQKQFLAHFKPNSNLNFDYFQPHEVMNQAFLVEPRWRYGWKIFDESNYIPSKQQLKNNSQLPLCHYNWEHAIDYSLPEFSDKIIPSTVILNDLNLIPASRNCTEFLSTSHELAFISHKLSNNDETVLICSEMFNLFLKNNELTPLWILIAERNFYANGYGSFSYRRYEGIAWLQNTKICTTQWNREDKRV
jgi:hypothetical protein